MNWHYQVMRRKVTKEERPFYTDGYEYGIHEFYPSEGKYKGGWTVKPEIRGESVKDVENQLHFMLADMEKHGIKDFEDGSEV